ncbi:uncharacterized protein A1O9_02481 [Exophiala aquamarina CBS 119918]|uniref:Oxidoreductase n=1 Tax=Exophiala aquamarina CBS 119918 TaxID=1182545 RepID=A0A072PME1_9EURO|nr:uncharacterized protein A1O9_02481 [Exophiala aquamarina CBS 119918]KEF60917.1 hypothetical protein A1O9_02481 [Exophiala aquamarina CBS 119918]
MDQSQVYGFVATQHNDTYPAIDPLKSDLSGKNVLITGGSRGLGREMALSYAKAGASGIAVLDVLDSTQVNKEIIETATAAGRPRPKVVCLKTDITNLASVESAAESIKSELGSLDILINNAGYGSPYVSVTESDPEKWWRNFEVNVKGVYLMVKSFLPLILESQDKTIVVLSSIGAHHVVAGGSGYEPTKLTVLKFNEYLMAEYGSKGLLVYAIAPGGVLTAMSSDAFPSHLHHLLGDKPCLVADTLTFLTKERRDWLASRYVDSKWDMEEFLAKKEAILKDDLLKVRLRV